MCDSCEVLVTNGNLYGLMFVLSYTLGIVHWHGLDHVLALRLKDEEIKKNKH